MGPWPDPWRLSLCSSNVGVDGGIAFFSNAKIQERFCISLAWKIHSVEINESDGVAMLCQWRETKIQTRKSSCYFFAGQYHVKPIFLTLFFRNNSWQPPKGVLGDLSPLLCIRPLPTLQNRIQLTQSYFKSHQFPSQRIKHMLLRTHMRMWVRCALDCAMESYCHISCYKFCNRYRQEPRMSNISIFYSVSCHLP